MQRRAGPWLRAKCPDVGILLSYVARCRGRMRSQWYRPGIGIDSARKGTAVHQSTGADHASAGDDVITTDGETIGTVAAVHESYLLVEKGVLFLTDYHVPLSAIDRYDADEGNVYLKLTR